MVTWLAWRTLRWHPGSLIGTWVTLVVAATAVAALWFVVDTTDRRQVPVERYAGVPLVAGTAGGGISPGLVVSVRSLPEVAAAVPERSFPAGLSVHGRPVRVPGDQNAWPWGHGWSSARLTPFALRDGRPPRARDEVVVDARLAAAAGLGVGDRVEVTVAGTIRTCEVVGVAAARSAWRYQSALFFADGHVTKLLGGRRGADALGVFPRPGVGTQALRAAVARAVQPYNAPGLPVVSVATGADRGEQENNFPSPAGFNTLWFSVWITALISTGMIAAAMGVSVRRRGMEIAVLRAIGARPGQIRRMLLAEGVSLAVVAAAVAVPLGMLLAPAVAARFRDLGAVSVAFEVGYRPAPMAGTLALALAMALTANLISVRRALRIRPGDALGEAPAEGRPLGKGRLLTGLALLAGAGALSAALLSDLFALYGPALMALQFATLGLAVSAAGLLAPWGVLVAGRLVRPVVARLSPVSGHLAAAAVVFNHRRYAGAVASLTLGLALVGVVTGTQLFYDWRVAAQAVRDVRADFVLRPTPGAGALSEVLRRRVLAHEGTSAAVGIGSMPAAVSVEGRPAAREPLPPASVTLVTGDITQVLDLPVRGRPSFDLGVDEIAMSDALAARAGAGLGSRLRIRLPGTAEDSSFTVTTIYTATPEVGLMLLPAGAIAGTHLTSNLHERIYVRGADPGEVVDARSAVESLTRQQYMWRKSEENAARNRLMPYLSVLVAVFCAVAAVNSLCLALVDRRREFTGLRQLGMRRGRLAGMACWESVLTVVPVLVLALAACAWLVAVQAASEPGGVAGTLSFIPFGWLAALGGGALAGTVAGSLLVIHGVMRNNRQEMA
ncbi:ABC transporter permease [[Actinomadura] parvosata]|uniref:ABC transporter permease n=1 Tax=[Actinomadura] parvosata TaxID=1955412 RepID=UPI0016473F87